MATPRKPKKRTSRSKSGASRSKKTAPQKDTSAKKQTAGSRFPIVGIGASAGGFEALRRLLEAVPDEAGVAFVVVQHLDPTKKSLAPELLAKYTKMQVAQVADDPHVVPNHVYVIPPNKFLSIADGQLHLSAPEAPRGSRMAIDFFLRSLAKDQHQCAVGVILSGTGADGTLGAKAIKTSGGLVIAQDPETADYGGMPRSAIEAGVVNHVLPPEKIPPVLVRYARHAYVHEGPAAAVEDDDAQQEKSQQPSPDGFQGVVSLLRAHGKHDFQNYKENTLVRRTRRRMCLHHLDDYDQYHEFLRNHPQEIEALIRDLLISVTDFFRDASAWKELAEQVIRPIVEAKHVDDVIRVWVPGCATGEEAYSTAMLMIEALHKQQKSCPLQIFASDIDKRALDFARAGRYPRTIEADVPAERLTRYFTQKDDDDNHYSVSKALREAVVFAEQNLLADPPFSKVDLICCRNLLIYLKPAMQESVLRLFHFALNHDGYLFLGTSETVGRHDDLFATISREWRIFRRKGATRHDLVDIPLSKTAPRYRAEPPEPPREPHKLRLEHLVEQQLLDMLGPSAVVVRGDWQIQHIRGEVDPYLKLAPGSPSHDLLTLARRGLRSKLRGAVHKALSDQKPVSVTANLQREGGYHPIRLDVRPLHDPDHEEDLALVVFDEFVSTTRARVSPHDETDADESSLVHRSSENDTDIDEHEIIRQLEDELGATKEDLQTTVEQYETSSEEHKAANEEVMSINEELQSTNEELETSKEELQSLNEELSTVNNQLASKVEELETKHDDLQNLLQVSHLATICLDNQLNIRWFSEQAAELIRVTSADVGRPVSDFAHEFLDGDIDRVARQVLDRLTPEEREVATKDDRWFLRRTTPYRTEDDRIGGVVITFIDITQRKRSEAALESAKELSEKVIDTVREATLVLDKDLRVVQANSSFFRRFQVSHHETEGQLIYDLGNRQWNIPELRLLLENVLPENKIFNDFEVDHEFETIGRRVMLLNGRQIDHIHMVLLAIEDITELRLAEHRRGFLLDLTDAFRNADRVETILDEASARLCNFFRCERVALIALEGGIGFQAGRQTDKQPAGSTSHGTVLVQYSDGLDDLPQQFDVEQFGNQCLAALKKNQDVVVEDIFQDVRLKGKTVVALKNMKIRSLVAVPRQSDTLEALLLIARQKPRKWNGEEIALVREVAERTWSAIDAVQTQQALRQSEERVRLATEGAQIGIWEWDLETDLGTWDERESDLLGLEGNRIDAPASEFFGRIHPDDRPGFQAAIERTLEHDESYDHEFRIVRSDGQTCWLAGKGEISRDEDGKPLQMRGVNFDITHRKCLEQELHELNESLEQQVAQRTSMLKLLQDVTRAANEARTVEVAMRAALKRIAVYNGWQVGHVWRLDDDGSGAMTSSGIWHVTEDAERAIGRLDEFQRLCEQTRFSPGEMLVGAVAEQGGPRWIDDIVNSSDWRCGDAKNLGLHAVIAFPVTVNDEVAAVLEFFSDHPAKRDKRFMEVMPDVGIQLGHVIERKRLEREIAEASAEQQRRLGRELHDSLSQQVAGVGMMGETLRMNLETAGSPLASDASNLVQNLQEAQEQIRRLSHGLMPVDVDAEALMASLDQLADSISATYKLDCTFRCQQPVTVEDNDTATHLYRIAQEAVQNAVKHGKPTKIEIGLETDNDHVTMTVRDNGGGFTDSPKSSRGSGLRIMQYRADLIGAELHIESEEGQGVTVTCRVKRRHEKM